MIITYNPGRPSKELIGSDWEASRWTKKHDTYIIHRLWEFLIENSDIPFEELSEILHHEKKRLKRVDKIRSWAEIYYDSTLGTIEITNKGVLPNILIQLNRPRATNERKMTAKSCDRPCGPGDFYEGGYCDLHGCFKSSADQFRERLERMQFEDKSWNETLAPFQSPDENAIIYQYSTCATCDACD